MSNSQVLPCLSCLCEELFTEEERRNSGIHITPTIIGATVNLQTMHKLEQQCTTSKNNNKIKLLLNGTNTDRPDAEPLPSTMIVTCHKVSALIRRSTRKFCKLFNVVFTRKFQHSKDIQFHVVIDENKLDNMVEIRGLVKMYEDGGILVKSSWIMDSLFFGQPRSPAFYVLDIAYLSGHLESDCEN